MPCSFTIWKKKVWTFLFMLYVVPSINGCTHTTNWTSSGSSQRPVSSCAENGIHPTDGCVCMCVYGRWKTKLDTEVQRKFRATCGETPPSCEGILQWAEQFRATSSMKEWKSSMPPSVLPWVEACHMACKHKEEACILIYRPSVLLWFIEELKHILVLFLL
jgi:hypothetical protein